MSRTRISEWHKRFKEESEDVEDDLWSGKPTSRTKQKVWHVREKVHSDVALLLK